jgi:hypothetical protein
MSGEQLFSVILTTLFNVNRVIDQRNNSEQQLNTR